jgi:hypothetical protein
VAVHLLTPIIAVLSYAAVCAVAAALVACALRRWRLAARVSRGVVRTAPLIAVAGFAAPLICPPSAHDPTAAAVALSMGVSTSLNCGVTALAATLFAAGLWALSRARLGKS